MKIEEEIRQSKFRNAHHKAMVNLIFTSNWLTNKQGEQLKPHGITGQQFNILRILKGQHPQSISATSIKSRMLDKNSDISRLLDRMEAKGLIEKKTSITDKRAFDVSISTLGLAVLNELDKYQKDTDSFLGLTEHEAAQLSDLLDKCREGFRSLLSPP
jgi:DNA-binding MarR family transcriptional regulator